MQIVIPTRGRHHEQITWDGLPPHFQQKTKLVVRADEAHKYDKKYQLLILPPDVEGIAATRDWIIDTYPDSKVCMLDDDMRFFTRRNDDRTKFRPSFPDDVAAMLIDVEYMLGKYAHVGIAAREGANRNTDNFMYTTRMMRLLAYDASIIKKQEFKFAPATFMCDFHMTLELLRANYNNIILNNYCNDQKSSNAPGGCSGQRTMEGQAEAALYLAREHRQYVKVVQKKTKTAWGGQMRTDVIVQWKKAYQNG